MAQRTKVVHIVTRMNVGGVAVLLDTLVPNLNKDEFEVVLIHGVCESPESEYLDSREVSYRQFRVPSFHKSTKLVDDFKSIIQILVFLRKFKPHVIHTHTSKAGLIGRLLSVLFLPRSKRVHTFHGHLLMGYFSKPKLFIIKAVEKLLGMATHKLIAMGTQVRDDLVVARIAPKSKFEVFFPGVELPVFISREIALAHLNLDPSRIYCTYVGRITQIKRPDRLIDVAVQVKRENSKVVFLVVGDGDLSEQTKAAAENLNLSMIFLGWQTNVSGILAASDIAILVSDNEAVALSLIEAGLVGIPVVTTPAGSIGDVVINGFNGYITSFDTGDFARAILNLASDPNLRIEMGKNGKTRSAENFSVRRMVEDHQDLYKKLLRN